MDNEMNEVFDNHKLVKLPCIVKYDSLSKIENRMVILKKTLSITHGQSLKAKKRVEYELLYVKAGFYRKPNQLVSRLYFEKMGMDQDAHVWRESKDEKERRKVDYKHKLLLTRYHHHYLLDKNHINK